MGEARSGFHPAGVAINPHSISPVIIHGNGQEGIAAEAGAVVEGEATERDLEVEDVDIGEQLGERKPKIGTRPHTPTKAEVEEHNPLHVHYRTWCPHCVAGRSISRQHRRQAAYEESLGVTVSIDYAFMAADEKEAETAAIMIAYEHKTKAIWAFELTTRALMQGMEQTGLLRDFKSQDMEELRSL